MQFSKIIIALTAAGAGSAAVLPRQASLPTDIACVPVDNPSLCQLTFETNSGTPVDLTVTNLTPFYGKVLIYDPTCMNIGSTTFGLDSFVPVTVFELSLSNPLRIGMVKVDGNDWYSPLFEYGGVNYNIDSGCSCWVPTGQPHGVHYCSCQFTCHPWEDDK